MEWLCLPRFDGPSVFARLLDAQAGGVFRILAQGAEMPGDMAYLPNTNVLRTRFVQREARWELIDFAPRLPMDWSEEAPIRLVRLLRPLEGRPRLSIDFEPRLNYGRGPTRTVVQHDHLEVQGVGGPSVPAEQPARDLHRRRAGVHPGRAGVPQPRTAPPRP